MALFASVWFKTSHREKNNCSLIDIKPSKQIISQSILDIEELKKKLCIIFLNILLINK